MPTPVINSIELTTGSDVLLTTDPSSPAYNEFVLYGSNLGGTLSVELLSGSDFSWQVAGMSASSNSVVVGGYAFPQSSSGGGGTVQARVSTGDASASSPTIEASFVDLPLMD